MFFTSLFSFFSVFFSLFFSFPSWLGWCFSFPCWVGGLPFLHGCPFPPCWLGGPLPSPSRSWSPPSPFSPGCLGRLPPCWLGVGRLPLTLEVGRSSLPFLDSLFLVGRSPLLGWLRSALSLPFWLGVPLVVQGVSLPCWSRGAPGSCKLAGFPSAFVVGRSPSPLLGWAVSPLSSWLPPSPLVDWGTPQLTSSFFAPTPPPLEGISLLIWAVSRSGGTCLHPSPSSFLVGHSSLPFLACALRLPFLVGRSPLALVSWMVSLPLIGWAVSPLPSWLTAQRTRARDTPRPTREGRPPNQQGAGRPQPTRRRDTSQPTKRKQKEKSFY